MVWHDRLVSEYTQYEMIYDIGASHLIVSIKTAAYPGKTKARSRKFDKKQA
jgi:hypothetical protein